MNFESKQEVQALCVLLSHFVFWQDCPPSRLTGSTACAMRLCSLDLLWLWVFCTGLPASGQNEGISDLRQRVSELEGQLLAREKEITDSRSELNHKENILRIAAGLTANSARLSYSSQATTLRAH